MKTANPAIFIGVLACSLIASRAPLHAQPETTGLSISIEGDDKPWNQGVPIATRQAAREVFLEGNRLFNIPLYAQAAEKYVAAITQWKHPAFYFNLALTQLNLGRDVEAHENLKQALQLGEEPLGADHFREAQKQLQDLERHLGHIRITCPTAGAEVTLDGATVFTGPDSYEAWVIAKGHEIAARKPTYVPQARRVTVTPGKSQTIDLRLHKLIEDRPWALWKPWAVVGAGAAVAAASGVLHAFSARKFNDYDNKFLALPCANATIPGCMETKIRASLTAELSRARLEQRIAVGGYIVGGSVLAAGAMLLYLNRPRLVEQDPTSSPAPGVAFIPTVSAGMLGVLVTVSH